MRLKLEISRRIKSMGCSQTKEKSSPGKKAVEGLKNKVRLLQGEINEIMSIRESENQAYQCELMVFAFKQAEWRRERRRLKDEVKKLRKRLEGKKERLRCTEESVMVNEKYNNEWLIFDKSSILAHIKEKQARREETVEKWKQLYFAIKVELDDLIQRTHQGKPTVPCHLHYHHYITTYDHIRGSSILYFAHGTLLPWNWQLENGIKDDPFVLKRFFISQT